MDAERKLRRDRLLFKTILLNQNLCFKTRIRNAILYYLRLRGSKQAWKRRHGVVFKKHPNYSRAINSTTEKMHRQVWGIFNRKVDCNTLRICTTISGCENPLIVPEEIFQADVEPSLNRYPEANLLANKSLYNRWFERGLFPKDIFHLINNEMLDANYNQITYDKAEKIAHMVNYPLLVKPNTDSYGGRGIEFIENPSQLMQRIQTKKNIVIQEVIQQHDSLARYHPKSLNTVRVYLYRSVVNNSMHILNMAMRAGNGNKLDNLALGGLVSRINDKGFLHGYALDMYGKKYLRHPVSGECFNEEIPDFEELKNTAVSVASKLFRLRLVGLDLAYDKKGSWRMIEINTKGHSIRFAQYAGEPFFGDYTNEVIWYCYENHWAAS